MYNDHDGNGSVSVTPTESKSQRCNQFAHYRVKRVTFYAEAVHDAKVRFANFFFLGELLRRFFVYGQAFFGVHCVIIFIGCVVTVEYSPIYSSVPILSNS
jgi:hypothetical protein